MSSSDKSSMKRKQSSLAPQSLLASLGRSNRSRDMGYTAPPSSFAPPSQSYTPSIASSEESHEASTIYTESTRTGSRSVSQGTTSGSSMSIYGRAATGGTPVSIRKPEDVFRLVRERLAGWSYLMQWYNGDIPWLNSVHIARSTVEMSLGPKLLDTRARQEYALGLSLAALFDITGLADYLRGLSKLMDEWEAWTEAQSANKSNVVGPIRNLFRPRRVAKPVPSAARDTATAEVTIAAIDAQSESFLVLAVMPFTPDFFQVHASTCSIIRDVYKKLLNMVLPLSRAPRGDPAAGTLLHSSTIIFSSTIDGSHMEIAGDGALVAGELPPDRTLVGEGQKLTPAIVDLIVKVDSRLKKHYSTLVRDGDMLARKVLDEQLTALTLSLTGGAGVKTEPPAPGMQLSSTLTAA